MEERVDSMVREGKFQGRDGGQANGTLLGESMSK